MSGWRLEHSYSELPALFHSAASPTPVRDPQYVVFNTVLAASLGLDVAALEGPTGAAVFGGNALPDGARPLAMAYAGHQFGHFTGLGDGRAILLGEQVTPDGARLDVQLKGPGQTPYSRRGDGRAALGPMLRELVISEAMHGLGIPTSRSLAVVSTGELVYRERALPGAVLTRVAASHLRVGTFEWAAAHRDTAALSALVDYTIRRHYPETSDARTLFDAIAERQARLIAQWQLVGFVHGVMNTDNMALSGETLDYGPCAFLDVYAPATVFSSIDSAGRYAYGNQPAIAQWNLARLAEALLPLFDDVPATAIEQATAALARCGERFAQHRFDGLRAKLGLTTAEPDDAALAERLLAWMQATGADFTNTFRALGDMGRAGSPLDAPTLGHTVAPGDALFAAWHGDWLARLGRQPSTPHDVQTLMRRHNPAIIPRNHKVEEALAAATDGELAPLERLLEALTSPFDHDRVRAEFAGPPLPGGAAYRTFCGT